MKTPPFIKKLLRIFILMKITIKNIRHHYVVILIVATLCILNSCGENGQSESATEEDFIKVDSLTNDIIPLLSDQEQEVYDSLQKEVIESYENYNAAHRKFIVGNDTLLKLAPCTFILQEQQFRSYLNNKTEKLDFLIGNASVISKIILKTNDPQIEKIIIERDIYLRPLLWPHPSTITYAIARNSFLNDAYYLQAQLAVQQAAYDWEGLTGVKMVYLKQFDNQVQFNDIRANLPPALQMVLVYQRYNSAIFEDLKEYQKTWAIAFNREFPRDLRLIRLCQKFFEETRIPRSGILRHEIGHIMGFRHEHAIAAGTNCPMEDLGMATPLGPYDPNSVMHYTCGLFNNYNYNFSFQDSIGIKSIY